MIHQVKHIVSLGIRDHGTQTIIQNIMRERDGGEEIADPDVRAMVKDYSERTGTVGKSRLQDVDEAKEKHPYSVDGLLDDHIERITIRIPTKSDGDDERDDGSSSVFTPEDEKFRRYRHHQYVRRWGLFEVSDGLDEEWFIADPPVLSEDDPEFLCDMCRHIDFNILFTKRGLVGNVQPGPTRIALYALGKVLRSGNCSFCSLLRRKIANDKLLPDFPVERLEGETFYLNVIDDGPGYALKLEVEFESYMRGKSSNRVVLQRIDETGTEPLRLLPVRQEEANLERLRRWLRTCEDTHAASPEERGDSMTLTSLRVIDTVENRVCEIELSMRYACLSYVWGTGGQAQYTGATKEVMEAPQGLLDDSIDLPRTIRDSIEVTRRIGLRYLWIDALCILQDDSEDKAKVISQMHAIYGNAVLTIVAATNSSPSEGLAGAGSVPRSQSQIVEKLQGMTVGVAFHDARKPHAEVENSVWNSRAWTFQEHFLSRRVVFFTDSQMTFTCPHAVTRFEDTVPVADVGYRPTPINDETKYTSRMNELIIRVWSDPTQAAHANKAFITDYGTMVWRAADPNSPDGVSAAAAPIYEFGEAPSTDSTGPLQLREQTLWDVYRRAVSNYTKRKMTWGSDAVNAFSGIAELIRRGTNTKFWYGMPEFAFDRALLWHPQEPLKRRRNEDGVPLFPSWAWCAWEGHSSYRGRGFYNAVYHSPTPVVQWLEQLDKQAEIERIMSIKGALPEQVEQTIRYIRTNLLLSNRNPYALWHIDNPDDGWRVQRNEATNEHFYTHAAYPGIRFNYPISLPSEEIPELPLENNLLAFIARSVPVRFCDMAVEGHVKEAMQHDYLQVGLNDEKRSANYRPPWRRIIYHQGYRAGFLSLNVPFEEIDPHAEDLYSLVAVSRDSLPSIAPPNEGWDMYWRFEPRTLQHNIFKEEWCDDKFSLPPPNADVAPDTGPYNENGDPFWDTERFRDAARFDVYNVLLLRKHGTPVRGERIGVGKMMYHAFHHAQPRAKTIIIS
ncbi:Heterokaryon incompatibility protein 6, OR allele [Madurella mycetomatis]|uniref:Heterokaryon incompatibility protein 6, OR allele n=1 Tax=Madurella mycetomatis TaxID=100816 RepID=A0A175VU07_9PEZI|nr:Heterokaryon incompatibility protein 6, OR allele [Madurella mycetomatis]